LLSNDVAIIDYNMGNLNSVKKAFQKVGANVVITNDRKTIQGSSKIVLPGVGSFKDGMKNLQDLGLISLLNTEVIKNKKPFLGICLGMQLIGIEGYEIEKTDGLKWIEAETIKFNFSDLDKKLKVPHVGWNNVSVVDDNPLYKGIENDSDFYFVHSYHLKINEKNVIKTITDHGISFVSSVQKENICACQFHPEKSQVDGLKFLINFLKM
tara:strand:- start:829 stop:1458 length:630 start_codon:yes stop_codon:yes gene_type:complete